MSTPLKVFRLGNCSAAVFPNSVIKADGIERTFLTVVPQRRFRRGDDWETTNSYTCGQLPDIIRVLQLAQQFVEQEEACIDFEAS